MHAGGGGEASFRRRGIAEVVHRVNRALEASHDQQERKPYDSNRQAPTTPGCMQGGNGHSRDQEGSNAKAHGRIARPTACADDDRGGNSGSRGRRKDCARDRRMRHGADRGTDDTSQEYRERPQYCPANHRHQCDMRAKGLARAGAVASLAVLAPRQSRGLRQSFHHRRGRCVSESTT